MKLHPEVAARKAQLRRARLAGLDATLTEAEWHSILEHFSHACAYCLRTDRPLTKEHVIPVSRGGAYIAENIVPACGSCNSKKQHRPVWVMLREAA
jgi:5-methylcytosine-specific restriction endonuclease McrA